MSYCWFIDQISLICCLNDLVPQLKQLISSTDIYWSIFNCSVMTILKHEAKKIDNFSKVKFPISVFSVRLCNNCSIKEKYTLHLKKEKKKKRKVQASVCYIKPWKSCWYQILYFPMDLIANRLKCHLNVICGNLLGLKKATEIMIKRSKLNFSFL